MKLKLFLYATLSVVVFSLSQQVATAVCGDTQNNNGAETYTGTVCQDAQHAHVGRWAWDVFLVRGN